MMSKSEKKNLYFWAKISVFILKKIKPIFCNLTSKFFEIYSFYLSGFIFDATFFSTYIHLVMYTYKTRQNIFVFCLKSDSLMSRYIFGNACIAINLYIWVLAY